MPCDVPPRADRRLSRSCLPGRFSAAWRQPPAPNGPTLPGHGARCLWRFRSVGPILRMGQVGPAPPADWGVGPIPRLGQVGPAPPVVDVHPAPRAGEVGPAAPAGRGAGSDLAVSRAEPPSAAEVPSSNSNELPRRPRTYARIRRFEEPRPRGPGFRPRIVGLPVPPKGTLGGRRRGRFRRDRPARFGFPRAPSIRPLGF